MVSKESLLIEPSACPETVSLHLDSGKIPESWLVGCLLLPMQEISRLDAFCTHLVVICREDPAIEIACKSEFKSFVFELICLIWRDKNGPLKLVFWIIMSGQSRAISAVVEEGLGYGGVRRFRHTVVKKWLKWRICTPRIKLENSLMPIRLLDLSNPIPGMVPAI